MRQLILICALLLACTEATSPPSTDDERSWETTALPATSPEDAPEPNAFVVHEWGTITSVQDSLGQPVGGLHHLDTFLPPFALGRDRTHLSTHNTLEPIPANAIVQRLETPILTFYHHEPIDLRVELDFPTGILSEWYPPATTFSPPIEGLSSVAAGTLTWEAQLTPEATEAFDAHTDPLWSPARALPHPMNIVAGAGEAERFLAFRALGSGALPIQVRSDDTTLTLTNPSSQDIPAAFFIHVHEGGGALVELGALPAGSDTTASPSPKEIDIDIYAANAEAALHQALTEAGLYPEEAEALVTAWSDSYFRTRGLRLLYIVPQPWVDDLVSLRITPSPDTLLRTYVGRVEVLLKTEEDTLLQAFSDPTPPDLQDPRLGVYGRFIEPRVRRVGELVGASSQSHIQNLLQTLEAQRLQAWQQQPENP